MREGPNIALIGSLIGDPCRSNMLAALMSGKALTATELSTEGGVTAQTASGHLTKMESAGLIHRRKQGRHSYFELSEGVDVVLESIMGLAASIGHIRTRTGPKDDALRKARICYDHLAGDYGVYIYDGMLNNNLLSETVNNGVILTNDGTNFVENLGIDLTRKTKSRRPICLACLDWSVRRSHMAGQLGALFFESFQNKHWIVREAKPSRVVIVTSKGERELNAIFS